jgi:tetratricopeptide (TPR) repeat protein
MDRLACGDLDRAWEDWRRSLACSPKHLPSILAEAMRRAGPAGVVDTVLPPSPTLLYRAALTPPLTEKFNDRRVFAARAAKRIADLSLSKPDELYARAWLLREAGFTKDAIPAYEAALMRAPHSTEWRLELAELLFDKGDYEGAEENLRQILREKPELLEARELNKAIIRVRTKPR